MLCTLSALMVLRLSYQSSASSDPKWPILPDPQFVVNGINQDGGTAQRVVIGLKALAEPETKVQSTSIIPTTTKILPEPSVPWKSLEILFTGSADGTLATFGGVTVLVKNGHLGYKKDSGFLDVGPLRSDGLNDVQWVKHLDSYLVSINGEKQNQTVTPDSSTLPIQIGPDGWKAGIVGVCGYSRTLTDDEVVANQKAGFAFAKSLNADTKTVTVHAELGAFTVVPELDRIAPYRSALVAEEYTILTITNGRMSALKPGMKVRVFRWGLLAGKKTDVANLKSGDKADFVIQPLGADPKYEKEFQVDTLDGDISALYFVDVTPKG